MAANSCNKRLRGWRFILFNGCLGLGHAIVIFNAGAYIAMLPRVAGGLAIPPSFAAWTQTDYMLALALAFPVGSRLSRRAGEHRPFVWSFAAFALASAACSYAASLPGFLAARIILGFAGGITLPLGQAMLLQEYSKRKKSIGISVWSLFTLTPFTFGPPLGGWIADNLGWRWLFGLNIPIALAIGSIVGALLYRREARTVRHRFNTTGFILLLVSLGSLQTLLNQGNDWDWGNSNYLIGLMVICVTAFAYWIIYEMSARRPYLDIELFKHRNFAVGVPILLIGFLFFQGLLSLLVVQLQLLMGYSSFLAGLVFLPMAIFAKPVSGIIHKLTYRFDVRLLGSLNLIGFAAVYFWLSRFDDPSDYDQLFWPKLLEGICLGSFFAPLTALLLHNIPPERQWRAVELATSLRIAAGGIGISLQGIVFYFRSHFHLTRFAEMHSPFNTNLDQSLNILSAAGLSEAEAGQQLFKLGKLQAGIQALNDAFWIAGCVFSALSLLVWLAHPDRVADQSCAAQNLTAANHRFTGEGNVKPKFRRKASDYYAIVMTCHLLISGCAWFPEAGERSKMLDLPKLDKTLATAKALLPAHDRWPETEWWHVFASPELNRLITMALADNPDIKAVAARLHQSQAQVDAQAAELYPTVQANVTFSAQRYSANSTQAKFAGEHFRQLLINPLVLRYHLDLWGRDKAALESAVGTAMARKAEQSDAKLLLSSAVAEAFFTLATTSKKLATAEQIETCRVRLSQLAQTRLRSGLESTEPVLATEIDLNRARQQTQTLRADMTLQRNRLATLAGRWPDWGSQIIADKLILPTRLNLPKDLPLHLLAHRPDVLAARLLVEAAAQEIKVATTAFYPDVNLVSFAGFHSVSLADVLSQGSSLAYAVGPSIEFPIFEGGRLRAQLKYREAAYDGAVEHYNAQLLKAAQEVADTLTQWQEIDARLKEQRQTMTTIVEKRRISEVRFRQGLNSRSDLIAAEIDEYDQDLLLASLEENYSKTATHVMKALGGGYAATTAK